MTGTSQPIWIIMPALNNPSVTETAIADCLAQSVPVKVLLILQQVDRAFRDRMEQIAESEPRLLIWSAEPPLPSLSATWNRALRFVWEAGGEEALVVNPDVRLHRQTIEVLSCAMRRTEALFVSAVGVRAEQFVPDVKYHGYIGKQPAREGAGEIVAEPESASIDLMARGGPDFSCFLISRECHDRLQFDEQHIPAYLEDLCFHREMLLMGLGTRIFSINLPFHHIGGGSGSLKSLTPEQRAAHERRIEQGSRAYYLRSWGGPANQERYTIKGDPSTAQDGVTTPELQRAVQGGEYLPTDDSLAARAARGELLSDRENDALQAGREA